MRLATLHTGGAPYPAWIEGERAYRIAVSPRDMLELIERWTSAPDAVRPDGEGRTLADCTLLPPLFPLRRNAFCVGWNYQAHFDEGARDRSNPAVKEIPPRPTLFSKATTAIAGPFDDLPLHEAATAKLDWEVELAVVIGRAGVDIPQARALEYVFGYAVANDVSARDLQRAHGGQWFKGKSLDASSPLGPWIVTTDEVSDPQVLEIECSVNGVVKQKSNTRHQIFPVARIIAELSQGMTLLPGDVILTGTPDGIGNAREPPEYLQAGDLLESRIAGLGALRNRIRSGAVPDVTRNRSHA